MRSPAEILAMLETRPRFDVRVTVAWGTLIEWGRRLEQCESPNFAALTLRRILASNSLQRSREERLRWDGGNELVAEHISAGHILERKLLCDLNAQLIVGGGTLRDTPLFGCGEEYLPPSYVEEAFSLLDVAVFQEANPVVRAFLLYVWVVTVHPFSNGNGRTARLAADWILIDNGYLPLCFFSPGHSHVALTLSGEKRVPEESFLKFLEALIQSYRIVVGAEGKESGN